MYGMVSGHHKNHHNQNPESPDKPNHTSRSLFRRVFTFLKQTWTGVKFSLDSELEDLETQPIHRPHSLKALCRTTKFTEKELKRIYRCFKSECPTGIIKEEAFRNVYSQFFPQGVRCTLRIVWYISSNIERRYQPFEDVREFNPQAADEIIKKKKKMSNKRIPASMRTTYLVRWINRKADFFISKLFNCESIRERTLSCEKGTMAFYSSNGNKMPSMPYNDKVIFKKKSCNARITSSSHYEKGSRKKNITNLERRLQNEDTKTYEDDTFIYVFRAPEIRYDLSVSFRTEKLRKKFTMLLCRGRELIKELRADLIHGLSTLCRGSLEDKLRWTFSLYDINKDGTISREEMTMIVTAVYELMGKFAEQMIQDNTVSSKVDSLFQKMDINKDGLVSLEEFLECCKYDDDIKQSMAVFESSF
ncbi:hypothetical protein PGB90_004626 [Kerria lacca]